MHTALFYTSFRQRGPWPPPLFHEGGGGPWVQSRGLKCFFYYSLYFKGSQVIFFWKGGPRPQPLKIKGGAYNFEGGGGCMWHVDP